MKLSGKLSPGFCFGYGCSYNLYYIQYADMNDPTESQGILRQEVADDLFFCYNAFTDLDNNSAKSYERKANEDSSKQTKEPSWGYP
jgi:hypothetical protein